MYVKIYYKRVCETAWRSGGRGWGAGWAKENRHMEVMTEELTLMKVKKDVDIEGERSEEGGQDGIITVCKTEGGGREWKSSSH